MSCKVTLGNNQSWALRLTTRSHWGQRCTVFIYIHFIDKGIVYSMCHFGYPTKGSRNTQLDIVYNCLPVPCFRHFSSQKLWNTQRQLLVCITLRHYKWKGLDCEGLFEHCALEGICLACILFGLFLPYASSIMQGDLTSNYNDEDIKMQNRGLCSPIQ